MLTSTIGVSADVVEVLLPGVVSLLVVASAELGVVRLHVGRIAMLASSGLATGPSFAVSLKCFDVVVMRRCPPLNFSRVVELSLAFAGSAFLMLPVVVVVLVLVLLLLPLLLLLVLKVSEVLEVVEVMEAVVAVAVVVLEVLELLDLIEVLVGEVTVVQVLELSYILTETAATAATNEGVVLVVVVVVIVVVVFKAVLTSVDDRHGKT